MVRHDPRDGYLGWIRTLERSPHEVHSAQGQVADWSHTKMLFAGRAKCSLCGADHCTDFSEVQRSAGMCLHEFHEPRKDSIVTTDACRRFDRVAFRETSHKDMGELVL